MTHPQAIQDFGLEIKPVSLSANAYLHYNFKPTLKFQNMNLAYAKLGCTQNAPPTGNPGVDQFLSRDLGVEIKQRMSWYAFQPCH